MIMQFHIIRCLFKYTIYYSYRRRIKFLYIISILLCIIGGIWLLIILYFQDYQLFHFPPNYDLYKIYEEERIRMNSSLSSIWKIIFPLSSTEYKLMCMIKNHPCNNSNNESLYHTADILFIIRSHVNHFTQRQAIRQTWANQKCYENFGIYIRSLFILGKINNYYDQIINIKIDQLNRNNHHDDDNIKKLYYEHFNYHDIIQFDFIDNYSNLLNKWIGSIDFIMKYCLNNEKSFIILMDDDYFLHPMNLIQLLHGITPSQYRIYASGQLQHISYPIRIPFHSRYISLTDYPYNIYPPYLFGGTIILSMPVVQLLYIGFRYIKHIPYDDIMLGIVLLKFGITPIHLKHIYSTYSPDIYTLKQIPFISVHGYNTPTSLNSLWSELNMNYVCRMKKM
ncbi:unnamed protein product [Heterobilharzia americana]|nr:unnamed protein product [Heterobilharzia americana]